MTADQHTELALSLPASAEGWLGPSADHCVYLNLLSSRLYDRAVTVRRPWSVLINPHICHNTVRFGVNVVPPAVG